MNMFIPALFLKHLENRHKLKKNAAKKADYRPYMLAELSFAVKSHSPLLAINVCDLMFELSNSLLSGF